MIKGPPKNGSRSLCVMGPPTGEVLTKTLHVQQRPWRGSIQQQPLRCFCPIMNDTLRLAKTLRIPGGLAGRTEVFFGPPELTQRGPLCETYIEVVERDALETAEGLLAHYERTLPTGDHHTPTVAVLNMAHGRQRGEELQGGDETVEVQLCRRTSLLVELEEIRYPLGPVVVYSRDLALFRAPRSEAYACRVPGPPPSRVSVVSASAPDRPSDDEWEADPADAAETYLATLARRIDTVLAVCAAGGHTVLVLGPWGCEGRQVDPAQVASTFRAVLRAERFHGRFRHVAFAVPPGSGAAELVTAFRSLERRAQPIF